MFADVPRRDAVGAFRGANYDAQAFYRPQLDCIMFTRNVVPFCRVCDAALERVIDGIVPGAGQPRMSACRNSTSPSPGTSPLRC